MRRIHNTGFFYRKIVLRTLSHSSGAYCYLFKDSKSFWSATVKIRLRLSRDSLFLDEFGESTTVYDEVYSEADK